MAKAGFWLRGARGKLAGASAQKGQNGTILREIVKPKNPKTEKQLYQRAIMATVMKAYSAGKEIFDHAFQGVEKGQKSQQYFIARNATLLRSLIADDINKIADGSLAVTEAVNACVAPKALYPVPGAYMVSEGTYEQSFFSFGVDAGSVFMLWSGVTENETVADYCNRNGLIPGDIYTLVFIVKGNTIAHNGVDVNGQISDNPCTKQFTASFGYIRLQVKSDVLTNTSAMDTDGLLNAVFEVTASKNSSLCNFSLLTSTPADSIIGPGSLTVIRSRLDEDLRSTSYMTVSNKEVYGITSPYILPTWKKGSDALGTSELILESDQ